MLSPSTRHPMIYALAHAMGVAVASMCLPGDDRLRPVFWVWLLWPAFMIWRYSENRYKWFLFSIPGLLPWLWAGWNIYFPTATP